MYFSQALSDRNLPNNPGARGRFRNSSTVVTDNGWGGGSAFVTSNGNEIRWANGMVWVRSGTTNAGNWNNGGPANNPFGPVLSSQYSNYGTNQGSHYDYTSGTTNINTDLNGSWVQNVDAAPCQIDQQGHLIRFRNLSGGNLRGRGQFNGPESIVMETDFGGGSAIITNNGNQINWANGIVWSRRY